MTALAAGAFAFASPRGLPPALELHHMSGNCFDIRTSQPARSGTAQ
jgi:hypothetical protein